MSPHAFSFQLTVPNDPASVPVITAVLRHAVEFATMDDGKRGAFIERVTAAAGKALANRAEPNSSVAFTAADGRLTVTIGGHAESESLPS